MNPFMTSISMPSIEVSKGSRPCMSRTTPGWIYKRQADAMGQPKSKGARGRWEGRGVGWGTHDNACNSH